ncbi:MAG: hypothetical protein P8M30_15720 [Planctomycetaceae bacterium]|jgi:spermidine synthase|nr:hypothetical protein [Planctomycetaceae bacterium]
MSQSMEFLRRPARRWSRELTPHSFCCLCAGTGLTLAANSWIALYGLGLSVALASVIAFSVGVSLAFWALQSQKLPKAPLWACWLAMTSWLGLLPLLVNLGSLGPHWFTTIQLESITLQVLGLLPAAIGLIGIPSALLAYAIFQQSTTQAARSLWILFAGAVFSISTLLPYVSTEHLLWSTTLLLLSLTGWSLQSPSRASFNAFSPSSSSEFSRSDLLQFWLTPILIAGLWACLSLITRPWALLNTTIFTGQPLILIGSALLAFRLSGTRRVGGMLRRYPPTTWLLLACLSATALVLSESTMTSWLLQLSSNWSNTFLQQSARLLILGAFPSFAGLAIGMWFRRYHSKLSSKGSSVVISVLWCTAFAWITFRLLLHTGIPVTRLILASGILAAVSSVLILRVHWRSDSQPGNRFKLIFTSGTLAAVVVTSFLLPSQTGTLPAKILFHSSAWIQHRRGVPWETLPFLDDGRLTHTIQTDQELFTVFNYRGLETFIRRNGMPQGYLSHDYRIMPQFPTDVLMTVLPTAIHGDVSNVAICRWGCGVTVSSTLDFPVQHIDCFDADPALVQATYGSQTENPWAGLNPVTDSRVTLQQVSPELALRATGTMYDVIISSPMRSATVEGATEMTVDFYRSAAARLAPNGLFCQRFQHYDHGPAAWSDVLSTLSTVFPQVVAVEMLPGETLFIAGTTDKLQHNTELADRLQKPQIRRVLARFGWDWGHVLQLPTVTADKTADLLASVAGKTQSALAPHLLFTHSQDSLRWANKWNEKSDALSPYRGRLMSLAGEDGQTANVKRRIEEVSAQQNHMADLVDLPWAYRSKLKEFLSTKPRSELRQVKGEKPRQEMHPIDQRRVEYLEALSDAHQTKPGSADLIGELNQFSEPYDPLISYFLHHEAAELYARNPGLAPQEELYHRLKTIYFGDVRDKSVRNVIGALDLILEQKSLIPDEQQRFDQLHGLVQFLMNRWQLRKGYSPRNVDEGLIDVRESLQVAEKALNELESLAAVTAYGTEDWQKRQEYLELHLVKPLRAYRGHLIPHHKHKTAKPDDTAEE